jgi:hypothetical protein
MRLVGWIGRAIGLDVHRDFCVIAICEDGVVRSAGRVKSTPEALRVLAESLLATDRVALEVTGGAWEVARILEPFVDRVIVVSPDHTGISNARAKTDKLDARALAKLLWTGEVEAVWVPNVGCRRMRRRSRQCRDPRRAVGDRGRPLAKRRTPGRSPRTAGGCSPTPPGRQSAPPPRTGSAPPTPTAPALAPVRSSRRRRARRRSRRQRTRARARHQARPGRGRAAAGSPPPPIRETSHLGSR